MLNMGGLKSYTVVADMRHIANIINLSSILNS